MNDQPNERFTPKLDEMLTRAQAAQWLQMSERELAAKSLGLRPKVPAFRVGSQRTIRYHPRTILAKMANEAGIPMQLIAASYGVFETQSKGGEG